MAVRPSALLAEVEAHPPAGGTSQGSGQRQRAGQQPAQQDGGNGRPGETAVDGAMVASRGVQQAGLEDGVSLHVRGEGAGSGLAGPGAGVPGVGPRGSSASQQGDVRAAQGRAGARYPSSKDSAEKEQREAPLAAGDAGGDAQYWQGAEDQGQWEDQMGHEEGEELEAEGHEGSGGSEGVSPAPGGQQQQQQRAGPSVSPLEGGRYLDMACARVAALLQQDVGLGVQLGRGWRAGSSGDAGTEHGRPRTAGLRAMGQGGDGDTRGVKGRGVSGQGQRQRQEQQQQYKQLPELKPVVCRRKGALVNEGARRAAGPGAPRGHAGIAAAAAAPAPGPSARASDRHPGLYPAVPDPHRNARAAALPNRTVMTSSTTTATTAAPASASTRSTTSTSVPPRTRGNDTRVSDTKPPSSGLLDRRGHPQDPPQLSLSHSLGPIRQSPGVAPVAVDRCGDRGEVVGTQHRVRWRDEEEETEQLPAWVGASPGRGQKRRGDGAGAAGEDLEGRVWRKGWRTREAGAGHEGAWTGLDDEAQLQWGSGKGAEGTGAGTGGLLEDADEELLFQGAPLGTGRGAGGTRSGGAGGGYSGAGGGAGDGDLDFPWEQPGRERRDRSRQQGVHGKDLEPDLMAFDDEEGDGDPWGQESPGQVDWRQQAPSAGQLPFALGLSDTGLPDSPDLKPEQGGQYAEGSRQLRWSTEERRAAGGVGTRPGEADGGPRSPTAELFSGVGRTASPDGMSWQQHEGGGGGRSPLEDGWLGGTGLGAERGAAGGDSEVGLGLGLGGDASRTGQGDTWEQQELDPWGLLDEDGGFELGKGSGKRHQGGGCGWSGGSTGWGSELGHVADDGGLDGLA